MSTKVEKERVKLTQEKCQQMLNEMLRDEDNKYCGDCDAKGPRWASWNLGIFLCIRCAGIHRNLGVHISKVKSVNLDTWTPEQVVSMTNMGNSRGRAVYEANIPDTFRRPQTDTTLENFIRAKYEHKKYIAKEFVPPVVGRVDWTHEIDELIAAKSMRKKHQPTNPILFPKLTIGGGATINTPKPPPTIKSEIKEVVQEPKVESLFDLNDIVINPVESVVGNQQQNQQLLQDLSIGGGGVDGGGAGERKMTKESILSLYNSSSSGGQSVNQVQQNPFLQQQVQQVQQVQQSQQQNFFNF